MQRLPVKLTSARDFFEPYPLEIRDKSRLRQLGQVQLAVNSEYLFQKLRWINFHGFSAEYLHSNYYLHDAIAIDLKHSLLRLVWKQPQVFITTTFSLCSLKQSLIKINSNLLLFFFSSLIFIKKQKLSWCRF